MSWIRTENINWTKMATVFGALVVFWTAMINLLPPKLYEPVYIILTAIQSVILYLMRSGNYVPNRQDVLFSEEKKP